MSRSSIVLNLELGEGDEETGQHRTSTAKEGTSAHEKESVLSRRENVEPGRVVNLSIRAFQDAVELGHFLRRIEKTSVFKSRATAVRGK
jgi:hypothetical protein